MIKKWLLMAVLVVAGASAAWAVKPGGFLFIKGKDVKLLPAADLDATPLLKLQGGEKVVWNGADAKMKQLHKVTVGSKSGFVLQANLTPHQPAEEYLSGDGKPVSAQAFASSGAATKAMGEAGLKYASEKSGAEIAAQILMLEEESRKAAEAVPEYAKGAGLAPGGDK